MSQTDHCFYEHDFLSILVHIDCIVVTTSESWTNCNILDIRGDKTLEERSENLTLTDLGAGSQHNLSCAGVNSVGEGEYDAIELLVYGKRKTKQKEQAPTGYGSIIKHYFFSSSSICIRASGSDTVCLDPGLGFISDPEL